MEKSPMEGRGHKGKDARGAKKGAKPAAALLAPKTRIGALGGRSAPPTHAWMRLARSWGAVLAPGAAVGFWLLEIIPDMLQKGGVIHDPPRESVTWPGRGSPAGPQPGF